MAFPLQILLAKKASLDRSRPRTMFCLENVYIFHAFDTSQVFAEFLVQMFMNLWLGRNECIKAELPITWFHFPEASNLVGCL